MAMTHGYLSTCGIPFQAGKAPPNDPHPMSWKPLQCATRGTSHRAPIQERGHKKINVELGKKFENQANPQPIPQQPDIIAYCSIHTTSVPRIPQKPP